MAQLRARFDIIMVLEVDGQAVQYEVSTNLRDQLELPRRFPKAAEEPGAAPMMLAFLAARRCKIIDDDVTFDAFVDDVCLDMQLDEPAPLTAGGVSGSGRRPSSSDPDSPA